MITALELGLKIDSLNEHKATVDAKIKELKAMALDVELAKGQYDDEINLFLRELTGAETGEVHITEIIQKVLSLK